MLGSVSAVASGETADQAYGRLSPARPSYGRHVTDFTTADFIGSHYCFNCHHLLTDAAGNDVSIISDRDYH